MRELIRKYKLRKQMVLGPGSRVYPEGRIINLLRNAHAITLGSNTHVRGELLTFAHGGKITLGDYCYVGENTRIWSAASISIGSRVLISHGVNIIDNSTHPMDPVKRHEHFVSIIKNGHPTTIELNEKPVEIQDDVWIGCMSIILRGVQIGMGAIIGAGSVVTKSVAPYSVVAGNPARVIGGVSGNE